MSNLNTHSYKLLGLVEKLGLIIIALATIFAMGVEILAMIKSMHVGLSDLLLMFIYLEVFSMVGIYLKACRNPICGWQWR
ncbi:hypothetical protein MUS1_06575 [Marinomonas ushuaiensis DSM 15871]|uniref:Phosphate-starvation-inducible E n=1 Tax=Marinomonas ushuaiensis DSM 15871 TaxID=1122207 RepID=X7E0I6_9GAMM|nr:phosphate-starvation-inducible PsiE family protein [Marinomonas ushuaiensis]ETX09584.1 hypothetical protein MUS1_06575 [Marinomonas ushuaiensis DSM 15871]